MNTGLPVHPLENDLAFLIGGDHVVDLTEAIRQNLLTVLPMQPLCKPDCAGLCPQCGKDRNVEPCDCAPPPDERWGQPGSLFAEPNGDSGSRDETR